MAAVIAVPRPRWHAHGWNRGGLYRLAALVAAALPRRARLALAGALGARAAGRLPAEAAAVRAGLARIAPHLDAAAREALTREVFRHFALCFSDLVSSNRRGARVWRLLGAVEGAEHLAAGAGNGTGPVLLTAHVGNWELAGRLLAYRTARPTHVVVAAEADPGVERFLRGGPAPVRFVTRLDPTSALPLVGALRRGEIVAMQGDRALGTRGDHALAFFGAPARFPLGPFVLARAARAPVVPAFCLLAPDRRYVIRLGAPIPVAPGDEPAALARWVAEVEATVRGHPEQWFNFFDVWGDGADGR